MKEKIINFFIIALVIAIPIISLVGFGYCVIYHAFTPLTEAPLICVIMK